MSEYQTLPDNDLIKLLRESDHAAYNEIYHRYFYLLYTHAYKKLRDEEQAKDVVQDVFTTLWFKRDINLPNANLAGYLFTAVRNKIFDLFAHEQVKGRYLKSLSEYLETQKSTPTDYRVREKDLQAYINKEIQQLPKKMRRIFEMSRKEQLSHKEIAETLKTSEGNVSKQVTNALKILRTKLGIIAGILFFLNI